MPPRTKLAIVAVPAADPVNAVLCASQTHKQVAHIQRMNIMLSLRIPFAALLAFAFMANGCLSPQAASPHHDAQLMSEQLTGLSFEDQLWAPLPAHTSQLSVHSGPVIIVDEPIRAAYRVIDKQELEFIGTNKSAHEFFSSAFDSPSDPIEQAFVEGLGGTAHKITAPSSTLEMFRVDGNAQSKVYVVTKELEFALEVTFPSAEQPFLDRLIKEINLKHGE